jgi:DNA-binding transcriptional regulator LsrR (DeoR family)
VNRRAVAIALADLRGAGELVLRVGRRAQGRGAAAALAALPVSTLVTDEPAARGLLGR